MRDVPFTVTARWNYDNPSQRDIFYVDIYVGNSKQRLVLDKKNSDSLGILEHKSFDIPAAEVWPEGGK